MPDFPQHGVTMGDVRNKIAEATRHVHLELHSDPVLSRLTEPDIELEDYLKALVVFFSFYHRIELERLRFSAWDDISLSRECSALQMDLPMMPIDHSAALFGDEFELLGGLYVAHGASFGRGQFSRSILRALSSAPNEFISLQTSKSLWKSLTKTLEKDGDCQANQVRIRLGAMKSFKLIKSLARRAAEAQSNSEYNDQKKSEIHIVD